MSAFETPRQGRPGRAKSKSKLSRKLSPIISKYPAYGKLLADRLLFKNPPKLVFIEVGGNAWERAKKWQDYPDFASLVLTADTEPKRLIWPVFGCLCHIEWDRVAPEPLIVELVKCLLSAGASTVSVMPLFVDCTESSHLFDTTTGTFIQVRECLRIYPNREEVRHVA